MVLERKCLSHFQIAFRGGGGRLISRVKMLLSGLSNSAEGRILRKFLLGFITLIIRIFQTTSKCFQGCLVGVPWFGSTGEGR